MRREPRDELPPEAPHAIAVGVAGWWILPAVGVSLAIWTSLILLIS